MAKKSPGLQNKISELKEQQLNAENNKAYLATINEAEVARADLAAKQARLASIEGAAEAQQAAATAAAEAQAAAEAKLAAEKEAATPDEEAAGALQRLKQLYKEQQQKVEPELLARYIVSSNLATVNHCYRCIQSPAPPALAIGYQPASLSACAPAKWSLIK